MIRLLFWPVFPTHQLLGLRRPSSFFSYFLWIFQTRSCAAFVREVGRGDLARHRSRLSMLDSIAIRPAYRNYGPAPVVQDAKGGENFTGIKDLPSLTTRCA